MKIGDAFKPPIQPGEASRKAGKLVEQGVESLVDAAGKLLRSDASRHADTFEKAAAPALHAMLDAGRAGLAGGVSTGARILDGLRGQLGRAESETRSLMRRIDGLRAGGGSIEGAAKSAGDLATSLLDSLTVAADALAQAQDRVAGESFLASAGGAGGRVLRAELERDSAAAQSAGEDLAAAGRWTLAETREGLARIESEIQLVLSQIEELRSRETDEQEAAQPGNDPLAAAARKASDAYAAIRDALDL